MLIDENIPIKLVQYIDFKEWLETMYPIFKDKEIETDLWEYKFGNEKLSVHIQTYDKYNDDWSENHDQFVGVGYECKDSGRHSPCDTFKEIRDKLDYYYARYLRVDLHPTYEELGHCYNDRNPATCDIEKRIGGYDARCKGCPKKEIPKIEQIKLF